MGIPGVPETTKFQTNTRCEIRDIQWFDVNSLPMSKTDQSSKAKLGIAPNSFFMVIPFLRDIKHWIKDKQRERIQFQQTGSVQRSRRASERENYQNQSWHENDMYHSTPQFRKGFDKTPIDNIRQRKDSESRRQRRDSERLKCGGGSEKVSTKKILTRQDSRQESKKHINDRNSSDIRIRDKVSPAKTPQLLQKSSRKQLFSEGGNPQSQGRGQEDEMNVKQKPERKSSKNAHKKHTQNKNHLLGDGFCPRAWQNFRLDHENLLKLATGR